MASVTGVTANNKQCSSRDGAYVTRVTLPYRECHASRAAICVRSMGVGGSNIYSLRLYGPLASHTHAPAKLGFFFLRPINADRTR